MGREIHKRIDAEFSNQSGSNNRRAKLNDEQVREIRRRYDAGERGEDSADEFGITQSYFNRVGRRQVWRHLLDE